MASITTLCKDVKNDKHYSKLSVVDAHSIVSFILPSIAPEAYGDLKQSPAEFNKFGKLPGNLSSLLFGVI
jgi:hypothetical protein